MAAMPDSIDCACGGCAARIISMPQAFVKDREYTFDPSARVINYGRYAGRSVEQQHRMYQRQIQEMHNLKRQAKGSKKGIEWLGTMPGEMASTIGLQEGDPEAVAKDPVKFLKKTGLYAGD